MRLHLKTARENKGFTVEELADLIDISPSFLYKIESGKRNPTLKKAKEIAIILGKTVDELFYDNNMDEMSRKDKSKNNKQITN